MKNVAISVLKNPAVVLTYNFGPLHFFLCVYCAVQSNAPSQETKRIWICFFQHLFRHVSVKMRPFWIWLLHRDPPCHGWLSWVIVHPCLSHMRPNEEERRQTIQLNCTESSSAPVHRHHCQMLQLLMIIVLVCVCSRWRYFPPRN